MFQGFIKKGTIDRSVRVKIIDSTDGTPELGVVFNTSGIDLWYRRELEAKTSITEATLAALTTAHADGGFLHIGDGTYRLDLPDAAFATGANYVEFGGAVTGMIVVGGLIQLVNIDLEDVVRAGLTALPNAAAEAAGGLYTRGTGAGQVNQPANGVADANVVSAAGTAWNSGAIGAATLAADTLTDAKVASDVTIASVTGAVGSVTGAVGSVTGNVGGNVTGSVGSVAAGGISEASFAATAGSFIPLGIIDRGTLQSATAGTAVLRAALALGSDTVNGAQLEIISGTGVGQTRGTADFDGTTDTVTVDSDWVVTPDATSGYILWAGSPLPTALPAVNVTQISGDSTAADNAEAFFDGTGYAGTNNVIPTVTAVTTVNGLAANVITAAATAADFTTEIQAGLATPTNITAGTITTVTNLTNAPTVGDLTATMKASVNAEVVDALNVDTYAEPGQGAPAATTSLAAKINYLFKAWRNKTTQDATTYKVYADDTTTVDQKATVSDDGTTLTRQEIATGP